MKPKNVKRRERRIIKQLEEVIDTVKKMQDQFDTLAEDHGVLVSAVNEIEDKPCMGHGVTPFQPIASVESSNVTGSPHKYLFIYLTTALEHGPHIIISDAREFGQTGIAVGKHDHYEGGSDVEICHTTSGAINAISELMNGA